MTPEKITKAVSNIKRRLEELEAKLADPSIFTRPAECKSLSRERNKISQVLADYEKWNDMLKQLEENRALLESETDDEFKDLIRNDIQNLEKDVSSLENAIKISLIPPEPNDTKNTIVEIRPAAGGEEAALFVAEMFRMYTRFAEKNGWTHEVLDLTETGLGGIKEVVFSLSGENVYYKMKFESGVHRVQRVPITESSGRTHTSTITVSVLPEAEEVEIDIKPSDLKMDTFRSSGPGGQNVNRTDSAVRITHIPTGLSVASQQEKSQHRNRDTAMRILRARLLEAKQQEEAARQSASKKSQVGTGERSERIRTYNFPQNRITDHRYGISVFDLPKLLEGELDMLLEQIHVLENERRLADL